jgi:tetratricopeptide (TPR) repeat protein
MEQHDGESDAAELVREEIHDRWTELSEDEQSFLWGLSSDLYMLENCEVSDPATAATPSEEALRELIATALSRQDWRQVLRLLRKNPTILARPQVAYLRASAYDRLDHLDVAISFLRYAVIQEPGNFDYRYPLMEMLIRSNRLQDALDLAEEHLSNEQSPPDLRMQAASVLFLSTSSLPLDAAQSVAQRAVAELQSALVQADGDIHLSFHRAYAYFVLGQCAELLGDIAAAESAYESSTRIVPGFSEGVSALARLRASLDLPGAIADIAHSHSPMRSTTFSIPEHTLVN